MKDLMKQSVKYIIITILALVALQACEKPSVPQEPDTPQQEQPVVEPPICTYEYDGKVLIIALKNLSDKKLPVLKVELSGEVKFTDKITQQGDVLALNVYYAEKFAKFEIIFKELM